MRHVPGVRRLGNTRRAVKVMKEIILLVYLSVLAVLDWKYKKVPLVMMFGGTVVALLLRFGTLMQGNCDWRLFVVSMAAGVAPGLILLILARITGKIGYGDGLALLNVGLFTDCMMCMRMLGLSLTVMSFVSIGLLMIKKATGNTRLPYLPFLAVTYAVSLIG